MASIFKRIIDGEIPCYKVAEDDEHLAFLDIQPLREGHVLVIPKIEEPYIFALNDSSYTKLWLFAKKVADAMDGEFDAERIGITVIGLEVPHTHIHLIPINGVADMNFASAKKSFPPETMRNIADRIARRVK
jgi:histidine triad (HIT) family protein